MTDKDANRERMLVYVRDVLIERGAAMRGAFEANPLTYCLSSEGQAQLKRVAAIEAAGSVFVHLVAEWQREDERAKKSELLLSIVRQAMTAFAEALEN